MPADYYEIIEVSNTSSREDIKKAYRRLALKWHPHKNPDNQEFATKKCKELSEAYEVLSDEKKRRIYYQNRRDGVNESTARSGYKQRDDWDKRQEEFEGFEDFEGFFEFSHIVFRDPNEVFREFFGGNDPLEEMLGRIVFDLSSLLLENLSRSRETPNSHAKKIVFQHHYASGDTILDDCIYVRI